MSGNISIYKRKRQTYRKVRTQSYGSKEYNFYDRQVAGFDISQIIIKIGEEFTLRSSVIWHL